MSGRFACETSHETSRAIARFAGDARGAIAVLTAMVLPVLIGIAAWAIDASLLLYRQERLQLAADIGARGGGELLLSGGTEAQAIAFAERLTAANVGSGSAVTVTATFPEPDRLELDASQPVPRIFSQIFGTGDFTIRAATVAEIVPGAPAAAPEACLYLDDDGTTNRALHLNRSSTVVLEGCAAVVASTHPRRAVALDRRASLEVGCLDVAGGIDAKGNEVITTLPGCPALRTGVAPVPPKPAFPTRADVDLPRPCAPEDEDKKGKDKGKGKDKDKDDDKKDDEESGPLTPGQFCRTEIITGVRKGGPGVYFFEKGLVIEDDSSLTLAPGAIIVLMDDLKIEEDATLTLGFSEDDREREKGPIIVLMKDAVIDMKGDATLEITAPEGGKWTGIAIMADRSDAKKCRDRDKCKHKLTGLKIDGAVVLPGEAVTLHGSSPPDPPLGDALPSCMPILAGTLELKNDARLEMSCSGSGGGGTKDKVQLLPTP